jgi:hypothetical protein
MTGRSEADLQATIYEFVHASTWTESRWVLAMHPELLTDEADSLLSRVKASAREMGLSHDAEVANTHQKLLRLSRKIGSKAAFAEITGHDLPPLPPPLVQLYDAAAGADGEFRKTQNIKQLSKAIEAFEAGLRSHSSELSRAPLESIEALLGLAISLRLHSFNKTRLSDSLKKALEYWNSLLGRACGSVGDLSPLSSGVGGVLLLTAYTAGYNTLPAAVQALQHAVSAGQPGADRDGAAQNLEYARMLLAKR